MTKPAPTACSIKAARKAAASRRSPGAATALSRRLRGSSLRVNRYSRRPACRLSCCPSRSTALTYKDKPFDAKQIGRELCVRYVLEGSVRRSGNRVRVNAQLIDAESDAHLWAERFDGDTGDLLALQDEFTSRLANALGAELIAAEAARPTDNPDALDYTLRGRAAGLKRVSRDTHAERMRMFEHALALDP